MENEGECENEIGQQTGVKWWWADELADGLDAMYEIKNKTIKKLTLRSPKACLRLGVDFPRFTHLAHQ